MTAAEAQGALQAKPLHARRLLSELAQYGNAEAVAALLDGGMRTGLDEALHAALGPHQTIRPTAGHLSVVELLLRAGADPNARGGWHRSAPIVCAAQAGFGAAINVLRRAGAHMDIGVAAALGAVDLVAGFLRADPGAAARMDAGGLTPLHHAAASRLGAQDTAVAAHLADVAGMLIAAGADIEATDAAVPGRHSVPAMTPLNWAARADNRTVAACLLEHGANPNAGGAWGFPLQGATVESPTIADLLLAHGADVHAASPDDGATILHVVANKPYRQAVAWLLAHGADANARMHDGRTPLHRAAERNMAPHVVRMLLAAGADVNARDAAGMTPLGYALQRGKAAVGQVLREAGGVA